MFQAAGEKVDTMTSKDAALFPIIASCALFGLYIVFTVMMQLIFLFITFKDF